MTTLKEFAIEIPALRDEAKARWGEDQSFDYYKTSTEGLVQAIPKSHPVLGYQHHLQQMLISDNPVKYLKDHSGKEA